MITHCLKCGGAIIRGDDFVNAGTRGFEHRDCEQFEREEAFRRAIREVNAKRILRKPATQTHKY